MTTLDAPQCVWSLGAELGEGALWSKSDNALWFVDIKRDKIYRYDPATGGRRSYDAPTAPGFIVELDGGFVVGVQGGLHKFDPKTGDFEFWIAVETDLPGNRLNDGAVDPNGRLWFGTMDNAEKEATGTLYRLDASGPVAVDSGYVITNGPTFSPDGDVLYHTDTRHNTIYAFDMDAKGNLSNKRVFVTVEPEAGHPDGPVTDAEGCVWTGLYHGSAVRRYAPDGQLLTAIHFPAPNVTKMAFGGPDLSTCFATTARKGMKPEDLAAFPLAGGLFRFEAGVAGL